MKSLSVTLAVVAIGAGALAPGATAWKQECPPGSHDESYCEHEPHHHHHHDRHHPDHRDQPPRHRFKGY